VFRWLIAAIALWSSYANAYEPPTPVTVYADDSYPPYSYAINGEAKGIYTEILQTIFAQMEAYDVKIQPLPWKRGLKMLELGKGFALYPPYYYANQRFYISPYSEPILDEQVVVFCRPDKVADRQLTSWPDDYLGLTIGINEGFALGGQAFWDAVSQEKLTLRPSKGNEASLLNLYKRRTDCYINDRISIRWYINQMIKDGQIDRDWQLKLGSVVSTEQGYLGFTNQQPELYPYKQDFIMQFNRHLKRLKQDGTIDRLVVDYLDAYK